MNLYEAKTPLSSNCAHKPFVFVRRSFLLLLYWPAGQLELLLGERRGGRAIKKYPRSFESADGEAVKKLESSAIPLLASLQGGVAERFRKYREASAYREAGVVFR